MQWKIQFPLLKESKVNTFTAEICCHLLFFVFFFSPWASCEWMLQGMVVTWPLVSVHYWDITTVVSHLISSFQKVFLGRICCDGTVYCSAGLTCEWEPGCYFQWLKSGFWNWALTKKKKEKKIEVAWQLCKASLSGEKVDLYHNIFFF